MTSMMYIKEFALARSADSRFFARAPGSLRRLFICLGVCQKRMKVAAKNDDEEEVDDYEEE